jgi:hypothetical protein
MSQGRRALVDEQVKSMRDGPCKTTLEKATGETKDRTNGGPDDDKNIRGEKEESRGKCSEKCGNGRRF